MATSHCSGAARALYRVFVAPIFTAPKRTPAVQRFPKPLPQPTNRSFTTSRPQLAKTRPPEERNHKWNEEITHPRIILVNVQTNELSNVRSLSTVLANLNRDTHRLVQVAEKLDPDYPPLQDPEATEEDFAAHSAACPKVAVCKIEDKKAMYQREKNTKLQQKQAKKASAVASSVKTLEMNWAIDGNDLGHRLERLRAFLGEGRKVEVVLAAKKAGRKATGSEREDVLRRIREAVEAVPGAKEAKPLEGKMGGFCTILFAGKVPQAQGGGGQKAKEKKPQAQAASGG